jgi:ADP-ribose pyrophosphatase YjhB (NUDIX family)
MIVRKKNAHCSYCGHPFAEDQVWPRLCAPCGNISYVNPLPVAVALVPVDTGLLVIRRTIEPGKGELALPGGFLEANETWEEGCARELREETGVVIEPGEVRLFRVWSAARQGLLLIFGVCEPRRLAELPAFTVNDEVSEMLVLHQPRELAFPLHTRVMDEYFRQRGHEDSRGS